MDNRTIAMFIRIRFALTDVRVAYNKADPAGVRDALARAEQLVAELEASL